MLNAAPRSAGHVKGAVEVGPVLDDRAGHRRGIVGHNEATVRHVLNQPAVAGNRRRDHRHAQCHRFQQRNAHPLLARRQHKQVRRAQLADRIGGRPRQIDPFEPELRGQPFEARSLGPFADEREPCAGKRRPDRRPGTNQNIEPLLGREPADIDPPRRLSPVRPALPCGLGNRHAVGNRLDLGRLVTRLAQFLRHGLRDRDQRVGLLATLPDPAAKPSPRLPRDIARRPRPLGPQHDRKPAATPHADSHERVVLEHRDIRDVDRVAGQPPPEVSHVQPGADEPEPRRGQPDDRDASRAVCCCLGLEFGRLDIRGPGGQDRHLRTLPGQRRGEVAEDLLGPPDQRRVSAGDQRDLHGGCRLEQSWSAIPAAWQRNVGPAVPAEGEPGRHSRPYILLRLRRATGFE